MDNTINSLVSKTIGYTDQQVKDALAASPGLNDAQLAKAMETYGVSPSQLARVVGVPEGEVAARVAATVPPGQAVLLGDTWVQPNYQITGSGEDQQIGPIEGVSVYKTKGGVNDQLPVGTAIQNYAPTGEFLGTGQTQKVDSGLKEFALGSALLFGGLGGGFDSLFGGGTGAGSAFEAANAGASAMGDLGAFELANAGAGAFGADAALGSTVGGTNLGALGTLGGAGAMAGLGGQAALGTGIGAGTGAGIGTGLGTGLGAGVGTGVGAGLGTGLGGLATGVGTGLATGVGTGLGTGVGSALGTSLATGLGLSALGTGLGGLANQQGITDARNLINQYGGTAGSNLANAYTNAQNLGTANRLDLANINQNTATNLQNLYNQQVGYQQPYQSIGNQAATGLGANADYLTRQFTNADLNANLAPNYAFQLQQGQMANQRAANMGGGSLGGNALQGLQRYTQDYAGNAYQNAFNNFNTQRQNIYGNLADMAKIGTTSAGQLAGLGNQYGSNMGSLASNLGQNLTQSYGQGIGAANAYGLNTANLATGIGSALATNATQSGANNAAMLSNLGNTALLGSMLKAT